MTFLGNILRSCKYWKEWTI